MSRGLRRWRRLPAGDGAANAYAGARPPRSRARWREASWCALDFELTGLDLRHDEIISYGVIPIEAGRIQLRGAVSQLVNPGRELSEDSIRVHGIRAADLAAAPPLAAVRAPLLRAIAGRGLVVHTAAIERTFLRRVLRDAGLRLRSPIVDTEDLGRVWLHRREGTVRRRLALAELAAALGLPADRPHDALSDALTTAQVFLALATHLDAEHPQTVAALTRADRHVAALRAFHTG